MHKREMQLNRSHSIHSILFASMFALAGCASLPTRAAQELEGYALPAGPGESTLITEADIAQYPSSVQRYLHFMGVVGRPRDWSFRWAWSGRFRMDPKKDWVGCDAWQYNTRLKLARIFNMQLPVNGLPVSVRDTYSAGEARMSGKLLDLISVVDEKGEKIAIGELVTYLNDALMVAPSMLLGPESTWTAVDENTFDVSLTDCGRTVKARVFLDAQGALKDFSTTDRFGQDPDDPTHAFVRTEWTTPIDGWQEYQGRKFPTRGQAIWHFPKGDFAYAEIIADPAKLIFNVAPGK